MTKRVLHYVGKMNRGGMETLIMNLYRNIDRDEIQFDFAVHSTVKADFDDEIRALGGHIYFFPVYRKNPFAYRKCWKIFWEEHRSEYIAFHFHTNSLANMTALEEAANVGIKVRIVHSHSSFANKGKLQLVNNFLHKYHQKKLSKYATNLLACSSEAAQWLYGGMKLGNISVQILKNGIPIENFKFDEHKRQQKREELNLIGKKIVGHIGKFIEVKNHTFLIDVIDALIKQDDSIEALLIGDGELQSRIKQKVDDLGLASKVHFLGVRYDINELLMCMDVFVMPSLYEGLPVSMIEVQASGLPAVISDTISDEVKLKENIFFESLNNDASQWAEKILFAMKEKRIKENECLKKVGFDIVSSVEDYKKQVLC